MGIKKPYTPSSRIRQALRLLWLRSRERAEALRNTGNCCSVCGVKASVAKGREVKLDVHHVDGCDWDGVIDMIRRRILQTPDRLAPLCKGCHDAAHEVRK
jgi:predicted HNH restriction endonuclease